MSKYVSVYLMGGLGNQLFQIFASLAFCLENNYDLIMPYSETLKTGHVRSTYWDNFLKELKCFTNLNEPITNEKLFSFPMFREQDFRYTPFPTLEYVNSHYMILFGYFQSYRYFVSKEKEIFDLIKLQEQQEMIKNRYMKDTTNVISMHFRIGDYKNIQNCHPLMPILYYECALKELVSCYKANTSVKILYFCEEQDKEDVNNLIEELKIKKIGENITYERATNEASDWEQMLLMSVCENNIIANSSFSWFGAYFNQNEKKKVCYPSVWFGPDMKKDVTDLFPKEWIKIDIQIT